MRKIILLILLVVSLGVVPPAEAALIGYWDFNEGTGDVANDGSGFDNHASGLDGEWVPGQFGTATTSSQIVVQPDSSLLATTSLSITAWAKIDEFNGLQRRIVEMAPDYGFLFNPPNVDLETPFLLELNLTNHGFVFQKPALSEWFHAGVTWDGNIAQLYFNGVAVPPIAVQTTINPTGNLTLFMGAQGYTLDEVRVYNHALTQDEVQRDMNFDSTAPIPEPATIFLLGGGMILAGCRRRFNT